MSNSIIKEINLYFFTYNLRSLPISWFHTPYYISKSDGFRSDTQRSPPYLIYHFIFFKYLELGLILIL